MADKFPTQTCPLKVAAIYGNPQFLKSVFESGADFIAKTKDSFPALLRCDREKCALWSSFEETYVLEVDAGNGKMREEERTRTVEGCGVALIPKQLATLADAATDNGSDEVAEAVADLTEETEGLRRAAETTGALLIGAAKLAADKYSLGEEFGQLQAAIEAADPDGDNDADGEDEDSADDDSSDEEEDGEPE